MNTIRSQSPDSDTTTAGVRVQAAAQFLPDESNPDAPLFLFMYRVTLTNVGARTVKLQSRHWVIRDAFNEREDVEGPGVVGEFPCLAPGQRYEYTSTCPLRTRWGTMEGTYTFEDVGDGRMFQTQIGRFFLVPTSRLKPQPAQSES